MAYGRIVFCQFNRQISQARASCAIVNKIEVPQFGEHDHGQVMGVSQAMPQEDG